MDLKSPRPLLLVPGYLNLRSCFVGDIVNIIFSVIAIYHKDIFFDSISIHFISSILLIHNIILKYIQLYPTLFHCQNKHCSFYYHNLCEKANIIIIFFIIRANLSSFLLLLLLLSLISY